MPSTTSEKEPLLTPQHESTWMKWILGKPRLRVDWQNLDAPGPLQGRVTTQEELWGVLVTMAVASMRDHTFENEDIVEYVLYFFTFWGVVSATINYSTRFNDEDPFHQTLWGLFLIGMTFQIAYVFRDTRMFAAATSFLYLLMALAQFRVALALPRARMFSIIFGVGHLFLGALFAVLYLYADKQEGSSSLERFVLWTNALFEPLHLLLFVLLTCPHRPPADPPVHDLAYYVRRYNPFASVANSSWDVPLKVKYMIERFDGFQMMFIVVSVLFPIALAGPNFYEAIGAILLANCYVTLLKFTMFDVPEPHHHGKDAIKYHAIRRSRVTAIFWLMGFPLSLLGISITGLGLVGAVNTVATGEGADFARMCFCFGPMLTWAWQAIQKALHGSHHPKIHRTKTMYMGICAAQFLLPMLLDLGTTAGLACNVLVMGEMLALEVGVEIYHEKRLHGWDFQSPKLQVDWHNYATDGGKREMHFVDAQVSSHEQFFTVLVAVSVFSMNVAFVQYQNAATYILTFAVFYGVLEASMIYSCRFSVEDASHKLKWTLYEIVFLLMLEGLTLDSREDTESGLFKISTAAMFLFLAIVFFGRVAMTVKRARQFAGYYTAVYLLIACLHLGRCYSEGLDRILLWVYFFVWVAATPLLYFCVMPRDDDSEAAAAKLAYFDVPANVDYVITRFNGLFMEILTVSIIVPNAFYPDRPEQNLAGRRQLEDGSEADANWPSLVFWADVLVAVLAIAIKFVIFDIQPVDHEHHAFVSGGKFEEVLFLWLYPVTSLGTAAMGGGMAMMIPAIGKDGFESYSAFAQKTLCFGSCLTWTSLTFTKLLHSPSDNIKSHHGQALAKICGAVVVLTPLVVNMDDFTALLFVVVMNTAAVVAILCVASAFKGAAAVDQVVKKKGKGKRFTLLANQSLNLDDTSSGSNIELGTTH